MTFVFGRSYHCCLGTLWHQAAYVLGHSKTMCLWTGDFFQKRQWPRKGRVEVAAPCITLYAPLEALAGGSLFILPFLLQSGHLICPRAEELSGWWGFCMDLAVWSQAGFTNPANVTPGKGEIQPALCIYYVFTLLWRKQSLWSFRREHCSSGWLSYPWILSSEQCSHWRSLICSLFWVQ